MTFLSPSLKMRLGEHGRGGGAVAGDVVGLGGDFLDELGAHVLERVVELDFLGDVTPSLVTVGAPNFLSRTTLRPLGPRVTLTALEMVSTPTRSFRLASSLNRSCLDMAWFSL